MSAAYIMASRSRTLHVGVTSDLHKRVWQRKNSACGGFTEKYRVTRLVYFEHFILIQNAIEREKQIKNWRREKKLKLIAEQNPTWQDWAEGWYYPASVPPKRATGSSAALRSE